MRDLASRIIEAYKKQIHKQNYIVSRRNIPHTALANTIVNLSHSTSKYDDYYLRETILSIIPLDEMYSSGSTDEAVKWLLNWFKNDFFTWINNPDCDKCGSEFTKNAGTDAPWESEKLHGRASVVELYKCSDCHSITRFPRYNDPIFLMTWKRGRCGEWSNAFSAILAALGFQYRYVWNKEDHVWNEFYSEEQQRWIHLDSCEAAFDQPLLYANGWGKQMSYVVGFSDDSVVDLSEKYGATLSRDEDISSVVSVLTAIKRVPLNPDQLYELEMRDARDAKHCAVSTTETELPARTTGTSEWTRERGEDGV